MKFQDSKRMQTARLQTPTDLEDGAVRDISGALNVLLADTFALYLKTKNFPWHISVDTNCPRSLEQARTMARQIADCNIM